MTDIGSEALDLINFCVRLRTKSQVLLLVNMAEIDYTGVDIHNCDHVTNCLRYLCNCLHCLA